MRKTILFVLCAVMEVCASLPAWADGVLMRDVFAAMPDSIEPMVTLNNRLDCIDFIENDMEARVRNMADEYVKLECLTPDYARFRTSGSAVMELKLMTAVADTLADADTVLCMVRTVEAGIDSTRIADSRVAFFTPQWQRLSAERFFSRPGVEEFVAKPLTELTAEESRVVEALRCFCPMRIELSASDTTMTIIPQLGDLEPELRDVAKGLVAQKRVSVAW